MINELPLSNTIDARKLGRLFDNMSESYKLFWFQAIVYFADKGQQIVSFDELIDYMIATGWYMVSEYKLNLGPSDTMEKLILQAYESLKLKSSESRKKIIDALHNNSDPELLKMKDVLTRNVPYRLQAPYLEDIKGKDWNKGVKVIAEQINQHDGLLYKFADPKISGLSSTIIISAAFMDYIHDNYSVITGWIKYKMIEYLQKRNPSVPGIIYKIDPPIVRKLEHVTKYWKQIIKETSIIDIYSDIDLTNVPISIDHFVPWSYVAHDELWNLIPTTKAINSSKSNNLPDWDMYAEKMFELQYKALQYSRINEFTEKLFVDALNENVNDMRIRYTLYKEDQDKNEFINQLKDIINPIYNDAKNLGFNQWKANYE